MCLHFHLESYNVVRKSDKNVPPNQRVSRANKLLNDEIQIFHLSSHELKLFTESKDFGKKCSTLSTEDVDPVNVLMFCLPNGVISFHDDLHLVLPTKLVVADVHNCYQECC